MHVGVTGNNTVMPLPVIIPRLHDLVSGTVVSPGRSGERCYAQHQSIFVVLLNTCTY